MSERSDGRSERPSPRVRDVPAPRESSGVAGPLMRRVFAWPYRIVVAGLVRVGVRPWQLTLASLATNVVVGWVLVTGRRLLPAALLVLAGTLDVFDGAVARLRGEARRSGAFLDSVFDRISDGVLFACLFWSEAGQGHRLTAGLALATLAIALFVSQIRAEAEAEGVPLSEGLFQRLERYLAVMLGLAIPGGLLPALVVLVVLGGLTVVQRGWSAIGKVNEAGGG